MPALPEACDYSEKGEYPTKVKILLKGRVGWGNEFLLGNDVYCYVLLGCLKSFENVFIKSNGLVEREVLYIYI